MATPARHWLPAVKEPVIVRPTNTLSTEAWSRILGQPSPFQRIGGMLYISRCASLGAVKGLAIALAVEACCAAGVFGAWRLIH